MLTDILILPAWAALGFAIWSALSIVLTCAVIILPAILGRWRVVQWLSVLLALAAGCLWVMALAGIDSGLPLPTRRKAGIVVFPLMALWPALTAFLAIRYRQTQ
ncbi:hypothetical protein [Paracoccus luteus]|uniref:hypothetical protein n=1 Tax=Paracoccus luteus TaxID=2508543 RepID=UPI00106F6A36|nr:hypothetical protein [Paracoccus luteus]